MIKLRQLFCRHKWETDRVGPVFARVMTGGGIKRCRKCDSVWAPERYRGIETRWWRRILDMINDWILDMPNK